MLRTRLNDALKEALRNRDQTAVATLRLILAALKDRDIAARSQGKAEGLRDTEILELLQKMIKQRQDAIEMYEEGGRPDLVAKEKAEIEIIERFLPKQMSEEEMAATVDATMAELQATSIKDMGRVMTALKHRYAGQMDFTRASSLVKRRLV